MAIVVRIDGTDWLVDVGFGRRFPLYPLPIKLDQMHQDRSGCYRITTFDGDYFALKQLDDTGAWITAYIFTLTPRELTDYHQTSSVSYFTLTKLCTLVTTDGRITLTDTKLKITRHWHIIEQVVIDRQSFERLLAKHFGICLMREVHYVYSEPLVLISDAEQAPNSYAEGIPFMNC